LLDHLLQTTLDLGSEESARQGSLSRLQLENI